ncbi:hypothetical protein D9613_001157 [Agrocybe pediades]|uniref:Uncharacterized protein n=1 Tax=Agrocybe pediades TaxID=84607 RepID=A0A8H4VUT7_9AGAR|nr:hypothetical protein D9613_001157 [Agrocybe pediades]
MPLIASATDTPTTTTMVHNDGLKGKRTKCWAHLPQEIISLIATHYIYIMAEQSYCPQTWENSRLWYSRMAYTCVRDAFSVDRHILEVCPEWREKMVEHPFWTHAAHVIDPNDLLAKDMILYPKVSQNASSNAHPPAPIVLSPYQHLRNVLARCCIICRVNYPLTNMGVATAQRSIFNPLLGYIAVCTEHKKQHSQHCGVCLREVPPLMNPRAATQEEYDNARMIGIRENRDERTWPSIAFTCRRCRMEHLWKSVRAYPRDAEAIGGPSFQTPDWEVRDVIERFIEGGLGTIAGVVMVARDKLWLRTHTKYLSLGQHAMAASAVASVGSEASAPAPQEMRLTGAGSQQVREWALQDWARQRVMEGHWVGPLDVWMNRQVVGQPAAVPAVHPLKRLASDDAATTNTIITPSSIPSDTTTTTTTTTTTVPKEVHPPVALVTADLPPSQALCKLAENAFRAQLREILLPPMRNLMRKVVWECRREVETKPEYLEPSEVCRRMSMEDVVRRLREEEGVWYDGFDWASEEAAVRGGSMEEVNCAEGEVEVEGAEAIESSESSSSTGSTTSTTSPVLSTSTLQTTPEPSPVEVEGDEKGVSANASSSTSSSTSAPADESKQGEKDLGTGTGTAQKEKEAPRVLSRVPYVPTGARHVPDDTRGVVMKIWREACDPVYKCTCRFCQRERNPRKEKQQQQQSSVAAAAAAAAGGQVSAFPVIQLDERGGAGALTMDMDAYGDLDLDDMDMEMGLLDGEGEVDYDDDDEEDEDEEEEEEEEEEYEREGDVEGEEYLDFEVVAGGGGDPGGFEYRDVNGFGVERYLNLRPIQPALPPPTTTATTTNTTKTRLSLPSLPALRLPALPTVTTHSVAVPHPSHHLAHPPPVLTLAPGARLTLSSAFVPVPPSAPSKKRSAEALHAEDEVVVVRPSMKRSAEALVDDNVRAGASSPEERQEREGGGRGGTPPKRMRMDDECVVVAVTPVKAGKPAQEKEKPKQTEKEKGKPEQKDNEQQQQRSSPPSGKKRGSEELLDEGDEGVDESPSVKKARVGELGTKSKYFGGELLPPPPMLTMGIGSLRKEKEGAVEREREKVQAVVGVVAGVVDE